MMLAESDVAGVIVWLAGLMVVLVVGLTWALRLKRRMAQEEEEPAPPLGFTLSDLRQMHRAGQISDAEFTKAKDKIVDAAKKAAEQPPPGAAAGAPRDSADAIRARRLVPPTPQHGFEVLPREDPTGGAEPGQR